METLLLAEPTMSNVTGKKVRLRTCPSCGNEVTAENSECARCGISFRGVRLRRLLFWGGLLALIVWLLDRWGVIHVDTIVRQATEWIKRVVRR